MNKAKLLAQLGRVAREFDRSPSSQEQLARDGVPYEERQRVSKAQEQALVSVKEQHEAVEQAIAFIRDNMPDE